MSFPNTLDAESSSGDGEEKKLLHALKRRRRRSCNRVSITILNCSTSGEDSSSSSDETIYSVQGYETAAIRDETDSTDSDESRKDSNAASSPFRREEDDHEENVYRVISFRKEMHMFKIINSNHNNNDTNGRVSACQYEQKHFSLQGPTKD